MSHTRQLQAQLAQAAPPAQADPALQAELDKLRAQNAADAKTIEAMQHDVAQARAHASTALAAQAAAANSNPSASARGNALADLFKDPAMLESMRPQQISTMKMMYGPLVKQLNLSTEQSDKFYNILVDNGMKMLQGLQSAKPNEAAVQAGSQSMDADLRSLLGDDGFVQYQNYMKNDMADQTLFNAMKNDFADNPLSDDQQQQLLQTMKTARQAVTAGNPLNVPPTNPAGQPGTMADAMQQQIQLQEQINQNVLQQAGAFLTPAQLQTLSSSQSNMIATQKSMAPMMQKILGNVEGKP